MGKDDMDEINGKFWHDFIKTQTEDLLSFNDSLLKNTLEISEKDRKKLALDLQAYREKYLNGMQEVLNQTFEYFSKSIDKYDYPSKNTDKRFQDKEWDENPIFYYLKEAYLLHSQYIQKIFKMDNLDKEAQKKLNFHLKNFLYAISPTNFPFTNPEVIRETIRQKGKNLIDGFDNFLKDQANSQGAPLPSLTDLTAFKVGENLATTPGTVIYENKIFQLLQYLPADKAFYQIPILIIPPWINKYYIFDLQKENSFIRWNIERGRAVYVISWVNPDSSYANVSLEDYLLKGLDQALQTVKKITKSPKINALGFCVGGVALLTLMSYYQKKGQDNFNSATLLASPVDFRLMGDLSIFVDKEELSALEASLKRNGGLNGESMMHAFRSLRANELVWPNYINNYLLGKKPKVLDFLFWNSDITNLPAEMHLEYLREFYIGNALQEKNKYYLKGVGIDISQIETPSFIVATQKDHIVPWKAAYAGFQKLKNSQFLLGGSGHIAGIINPPAQKKYSFWLNKEDPNLTPPDEWIENAVEYPGSWWEVWEKWLTPFLGEKTLTAKK